MANQPIPTLPPVIGLSGDEQFELVQPGGTGGTTKRVTAAQIATFVNAQITGSLILPDLPAMTTGQIDRTNDLLLIYDTSAAANKKITPNVALEPLGLSLGTGNRESILSLNGVEWACQPNQTSFSGTQWFGSGGSATLTHTTGQTGFWNTGVALRCLTSLTTGSYNVSVGFEGMERLDTGSYNTGIGEANMIYATSATGNVAVGWKAMLGVAHNDVTGAANNGSGLIRLTVAAPGTVKWVTGDTAVISGVLGTTEANGTWVITVVDGTHIDLQGSTFTNAYVSGGEAFVGSTAGYNVAVGYFALPTITSGIENVVIGKNSGLAITTASYNTLVGSTSGTALVSGTRNIAVGAFSLSACISGEYNFALGYQALNSATNSYNIGIGAAAGYTITTGQYNLLIGYQAQGGMTTGSANTVIGGNIVALGNVSNNVVLGDGSGNIRVHFDATGLLISALPVKDSLFTIKNAADPTKVIAFDASGITTGTTRTFAVPNYNGTFATLAGTETLTNKTLTAPVISTITNTGTLTLPTSTDTLIGRATTDTLTNKTLTAPVISSISNSGTVTLPTGTRTLVARDTTDTLTNKTLTTPTIDTIVTSGSSLTLQPASGNPNITASSTNLVLGPGSALATNATTGHVAIPTCAGTPTGVPTGAGAGACAMIYDTTNGILYAYENGAWVSQRVRTFVKSFTRDMTTASGTVSYTGVGFKPTALVVIGAVGATGDQASWGVAGSAATGGGVSTFGADTHYAQASVFLSCTSSGNNQVGTVAYTSDGFDVTWTKTGSPTGTVSFYVLCMR